MARYRDLSAIFIRAEAALLAKATEYQTEIASGRATLDTEIPGHLCDQVGAVEWAAHQIGKDPHAPGPAEAATDA